jgi:hypothetical protein
MAPQRTGCLLLALLCHGGGRPIADSKCPARLIHEDQGVRLRQVVGSLVYESALLRVGPESDIRTRALGSCMSWQP